MVVFLKYLYVLPHYLRWHRICKPQDKEDKYPQKGGFSSAIVKALYLTGPYH